MHYDDVQFSPGSRVNRVQVKTINDVVWLTAPIYKNFPQKINETELNNTTNWKEKHRKTFQMIYQNAPYFLEALDLFMTIYENKVTSLCEFNIFAIESITAYFDLNTRFLRSSSMDNSQLKSTNRILDICQKLGATHYVTGHGAKNYIDYDLFENANISIEFMLYDRTPYPQLYGEFTPYVSIFDLIANCGKKGKIYLTSKSVYWKEWKNGE